MKKYLFTSQIDVKSCDIMLNHFNKYDISMSSVCSTAMYNFTVCTLLIDMDAFVVTETIVIDIK